MAGANYNATAEVPCVTAADAPKRRCKAGVMRRAGGEATVEFQTPDVAAFDRLSKNLIRQSSAYEVLPGVRLNGQLSAGENLADIGGVMLGYRALQTHLKANPQENRKIDGFSPQQRCFLAWSQLWAEKIKPELLRQNAATDPHPPGAYRMVAPASNHPGFYDAFGIRAGDRMWVAPKNRVSMW